MDFNINNYFDNRNRKSKIGDFQDLDHIDGVSISTVSAGLYKEKRDDLVLFYFRDGASHASVYTQSKIISENLKWNKKIKNKKVYGLLINTKNANALTGPEGFDALKQISIDLSKILSQKQNWRCMYCNATISNNNIKKYNLLNLNNNNILICPHCYQNINNF